MSYLGQCYARRNMNDLAVRTMEAALKECAALQGECRQAMLKHVYAVSAEMSPEDGEHYLKMMTARIIEPALPHESVVTQEPKR